MPIGGQFTLESMLRSLGYGGGAEDILRTEGVQDPGQYAPGLQRLLGVTGTQAGELGGEYSTLLEQIGTGRQQGMTGLREAWMTQAEGTQGDWQFGGRKRQLRRARRTAGAEQERLQTGYESDVFGAEQWMGGQYRDLLASLEGGITGYLRDITGRGAEFGDDLRGRTAEDLWRDYRNAGGTMNLPDWINAGRPGVDIPGAVTPDTPGDDISDEFDRPSWPGFRGGT